MPYQTIRAVTVPYGAATVWLVDGERLEVAEAVPADGWLHMTLPLRGGPSAYGPIAERISVPASQVRRVVW
jgi:hypothetical protein